MGKGRDGNSGRRRTCLSHGPAKWDQKRGTTMAMGMHAKISGTVVSRRDRRTRAQGTEALYGTASVGLVLTSAAPVFEAWMGKTVEPDGEWVDADDSLPWTVAYAISLLPVINWWTWIVIASTSAIQKERRFVYAAFYMMLLVFSWFSGENASAIFGYLACALHFQIEREANKMANSLKQERESKKNPGRGCDSTYNMETCTRREKEPTSTNTLEDLMMEMEHNKLALSYEELRAWDERYELRSLRVPELRKLAKAKGATVAISRLRKKELIDLIEGLM